MWLQTAAYATRRGISALANTDRGKSRFAWVKIFRIWWQLSFMLLLVLQSILEKSKVKSSVKSVNHYGVFSVSHVSHGCKRRLFLFRPATNQQSTYTHTVTHFGLCWFVEDGVCVGCTPRLHMLYIIKYARKHDTINQTLGGNIREFPTDFTRVKRGKTLLGVWCDCIIRAQQHQTCLTSSLLMVTVASATLRATGVQSSLLEEPIRLSIAPFSISMPDVEGDKTKYLN